MLDWFTKLYSSIPEGAKQAPAGVLLMTALITGARGDWMFRGSVDATVRQYEARLAESNAEKEQYKKIAFNSVGLNVEQAQQVASVATKAAAEPSKSVKVQVPIKPLTATEAKAIEKPKDAEPATLQKSLDASKKVIVKADLANAQPVKQEKQ